MVEEWAPSGAVEMIVERFLNGGDQTLFWRGRFYSAAEMRTLVDGWQDRLDADGVRSGTVCAFVSDFSPGTIALILSLLLRKVILVPFARVAVAGIERALTICGATHVYRFDAEDVATHVRATGTENALIAQFRERGNPGLVVFTSGSTGEPKGILHDCERVFRKFLKPRDSWRTVLFLMMDHFGGFNTFVSSLAYGGTAVCLDNRSPDAVCESIEHARATLLPTTPTFLNLLLSSGAGHRHDLSSVKLVTYGTEVMPEATLARIQALLPNASLKQTYGLSEVGVLRSRSASDDSLWVRIGGDGFEVKIVDNVLWIRSEANMVGYLNAPSPFDANGWLCTGDRVETKGDYVRILGRASDMINVGGQKLYPAEVESVLLEDPNVAEASVYGSKHPIMGQVVHADISLRNEEDSAAVIARLRRNCIARLDRYKVPVRFTLTTASAQHSARFKKIRGDIGQQVNEAI